MNKQKSTETYKTSSLAVACVLSLKFTLVDVDKTNPRRALFIFDESSSLIETVSAYWKGALRIDPQAYFNQLRVLKGRLYSEN